MKQFFDMTAPDFNTLAMYGYLRELELERDPMSDTFPRHCNAIQMDAFCKMDIDRRVGYAAQYISWMAVKTLLRGPLVNSEVAFNIVVGTLLVKMEGLLTIDGAVDSVCDADDAISEILFVRQQITNMMDVIAAKTKIK